MSQCYVKLLNDNNISLQLSLFHQNPLHLQSFQMQLFQISGRLVLSVQSSKYEHYSEFLQLEQTYNLKSLEKIRQIQIMSDYIIILKDTSAKSLESSEIVVYNLLQKIPKKCGSIKLDFFITKFWLLGSQEIVVFMQQKFRVIPESIICLEPRVCLKIFSLKTQQKVFETNLEIQAKNNKSDGILEHFVFESTNYICVVERQKDSIVTNYFRYDSTARQLTQINTTKLKEIKLNQAIKINNHSKIGWLLGSSLSQTLQYLTLGLNQQLKEQLQVYKFKKTQYGNYFVSSRALHQINQKQFLGVVEYSQPKKMGRTQKLLVLNKETPSFQVLKQPKCSRDLKCFSQNRQFSFIVDYNLRNNFGLEFYVFTKDLKQKLKKETIQHSYKFFHEMKVSGNKVMLILNTWQPKTKKQQNTHKVIVKHIFNYRMLYLHWLLLQNEDFDDDLLQDAVELLTVDHQSTF